MSFRGRRVPVILGGLALLWTAMGESIAAQGILDDLPRRGAELEMSLGAFDDPVLAFSRISDLTFDREGRIYVVQPLEARVTVVEPDGTLVHRLGREGRGPGEFVSPAAAGWRGDTLWVMDAAQRRVSYFLGPRHVRTDRFTPIAVEAEERIAAQLPVAEGAFYTVVSRRFTAPAGSPENRFPIVLVAPDGARRDTLAVLQESYPFRLVIRHSDGESRGSPLFSDFPLHQVDDHGRRMVIVDRPFGTTEGARIRVTVVRTRGDTVYSREFRSRPPLLTGQEWSARIDEALSRGNRSRPFGREEVEEASRRPPHWPSVSRVTIGRDGWVWLALGGRPTRTVQRWVAIDPHGSPAFSVDLPTDFTIYAPGGSFVLGVGTDEFDVPYVRRFRILGGL